MKSLDLKLDIPLARLFLDAFGKTLLSFGFQKGEVVKNPDAPDLYEYIHDDVRILVTDKEEAGVHKINITSRENDILPLIEKAIRALITNIINVFADLRLREIEKLRDCISK